MAIPKHTDDILEELGSSSTSQRSCCLAFRLDRPKSLSGERLDRYLADGWYRQGQGMFTTYSTISRKNLMSAPWIRIDTSDYTLGKNLRRLKNKNDRHLSYHIGQANITPYREEMFQAFRAYFKGEFYESLRSALYCYQSTRETIFDTREITFYKDGELVGYSYFDVGGESVASILNIYTQEHLQHSIGMYSILLQLQWCQQHGKRYYYPGYAMPENPRFDYKLRVQGVNYLDQRSGQWRPWTEYRLENCPLYEYRRAILRARQMFARLDLGWRIGVYLNHSNPCPMLMDQEGAYFLEHPIFLSGNIEDDEHPVILDYDLQRKEYRLLSCTAHARPPFPDHQIELEEVLFPVDFDCADFGCVGLLAVDRLIYSSSDLISIYHAIRQQAYTEWYDEY